MIETLNMVKHSRIYDFCFTICLGVNCERLKDDCINTPCQHSGTCVNTLQGYDCQCVTGYFGVDCEINNDDCATGPCVNDAVCTDGIADYKYVKTNFISIS